MGSLTFLVHDFGGAPAATADVVTWGAFTGLNASFETRIALASPANEVDITLAHFAAPATVVALDGSGGVVDTETMTAAGGRGRDAAPVGWWHRGTQVTAPQDETLILQICTS